MYRYKDNQPKRREIDGPFKGTVWIPGGVYFDVPQEKIGEWFEEAGAEFSVLSAELGEQKEIEETIKKNSEGEAPGSYMDDPFPM